jgi:diamine N-acetyltransferase
MIEFRKITSDNFDACIGLEPRKDQQSFVASNVLSLAESYVALANQECIPIPYAIYSEDEMVGFILITYNQPDEFYEEAVYWICRLMVDQHHQGRGYGREAMRKALELIRTYPCGKASLVSLSYEPENTVAKELYASMGFAETGKLVGREQIAVLNLASESITVS